MPIYPYSCSCGYAEDIILVTAVAAQVLHDYPPKCPRCGLAMRRVPGVPSIQFKGTGWSKPSPSGEDKSL